MFQGHLWDATTSWGKQTTETQHPPHAFVSSSFGENLWSVNCLITDGSDNRLHCGWASLYHLSVLVWLDSGGSTTGERAVLCFCCWNNCQTTLKTGGKEESAQRCSFTDFPLYASLDLISGNVPAWGGNRTMTWGKKSASFRCWSWSWSWSWSNWLLRDSSFNSTIINQPKAGQEQ